MQPSHLTDLLRSTIRDNCISRKQIIEACGGTNPSKAYRRLDDLLDGRGHTDEDHQGAFFSKVTAFLGLTLDEIRRAKARDSEEELAEKRRSFEPVIFVETEHRPTQITFFGLMNGMNRWRIVRLPDGIFDLGEEDQYTIVGNAIREHYHALNGEVRYCGKITGYRYCQTYDTSIMFGNDGECTGDPTAGFTAPVVTVTLGCRLRSPS